SSSSDAETCVDLELSVSKANTKVLLVEDEQGEDISHIVALDERIVDIDEGQARSDRGKTLKSRPPPEHVLTEEDQAGSDPGKTHVALIGSKPEPMNEDFIVTVYHQVHENLKHTTEEHVHLENPLSSSGTLSSMKNLEGFTFGDQFINDKSQEDKQGKENVETKVESMVAVCSSLRLLKPKGNPARANIKQALGYLKDGDGDGNSQPHKGVKASANSDVMYFFTSAQDGDPSQDDVRLCLGDDLKKAQDHFISHMRILSVTSLKTYERYGYTYLREIVIHRDDYNEYKISEADFKNVHPNDFEDLYLLHLQGKLNHLSGSDKVHLFNAVNMWIRNIVIRQHVADLQLDIESYQTKLNLTQPSWDALDFLFKEYYTIVNKPRAVIYRDRSDQKKMTRLNEVHKFSDGTLTRVMERLDHMVKDFRLFKYNPGMETRIWSEDDKRRSKEFKEVRIKMEMEMSCSCRVKFITACSFTTDLIKDIMKDQAYGFYASTTLISYVLLEMTKSDTYAGNPVKEILLKLNLPDYRLVLIDSEVHVKMEIEIPHFSRVNFITACSYSFDKYKDMMKAQIYVIQVFRYSDTQKLIRKRKAYIAEIEVIGPRLFIVEALNDLGEINMQETEKLDRLRTMLDELNVRLRQKRWNSTGCSIDLKPELGLSGFMPHTNIGLWN
ncbi:hypothetical protein Tco_0785210, partial [Tanacetum coccineum]